MPALKPIFLNNVKSNIKTICTIKNNLKFSDNSKVESFIFEQKLGLYGNLRKLPKDSKNFFFVSHPKEDVE